MLRDLGDWLGEVMGKIGVFVLVSGVVLLLMYAGEMFFLGAKIYSSYKCTATEMRGESPKKYEVCTQYTMKGE